MQTLGVNLELRVGGRMPGVLTLGQISSEEECHGQRASLYELHILLQESSLCPASYE